MARKRISPEQIITMLREAEVLLSQEVHVAEVWHKLGFLSRPMTTGIQSLHGCKVSSATSRRRGRLDGLKSIIRGWYIDVGWVNPANGMIDVYIENECLFVKEIHRGFMSRKKNFIVLPGVMR